MDKKEIKQLLDAQTKAIDTKLDKQTKYLIEETERHERVILEEFEHRLSVVAEMVVDHTEKLNAIMEIGAMNTETLEFIKSMLKRRVDIDEYEKLEKRVSVLEKKLRLSGT
jgi:hypothetical protein